MLDRPSKAFFHLLARSGVLKRLASRYGMRPPTNFARRFVAGETIAEAIDAAREIEGRGFAHTLDHLGESVGSLADADAATHIWRGPAADVDLQFLIEDYLRHLRHHLEQIFAASA